MAHNDTDETAEEPIIGPDSAIPAGPLGHTEVQIDVDEETYQRLHEAYCRAVEHGYADSFDTFVFNNCTTDCYVTVDGEPVDPGCGEE